MILRHSFDWGVVIDESAWDQPEGLAQMINGDLLVGGRVSPLVGQDAFVGRYTDGGGQEVWTRTYAGDGDLRDCVQSIASDFEANVLVAGIKSFWATSEDAWVAKIDKDGDLLWEHTFDGGGQNIDRAIDIAADRENNVFVTMRLNPGGSQLVKFSPDGDEIWTRTGDDFGDPFLEPYQVTTDACGNAFFSAMFGAIVKVSP